MSELATLEVDAGNSSAKWRVVKSGSSLCVARGVMSWVSLPSVDEFRERVGSSVDRVLLASVAGESKTCDLISLVEASFPRADVQRVTVGKRMAGVRFAYADCSTLGVDRCLAMVAACAQSKEGVLVLDCGSAITADFVAAGGQHLGGYIFPGVRLLKASLMSGTANVPVGNDLGLNVSPGSSTAQCVERAISLMVRSSISASIEHAKSLGISQFFITGGDAAWVSGLLGVNFHVCPDLVLEGLALVVGLEGVA